MSDRPRILLHTKEFPSPSQTFLSVRFRELLERGWDVHVLCEELLTDESSEDGFVRAASSDGRVHVGSSPDVAIECVERLRPDVLHFEFGHDARRRLYLVPTAGCALVVSFQGYDICIEGLEDELHYRSVWDRADMVHFPSTALQEAALRRGMPPSLPSRVIPPLTDLAYFSRDDIPTMTEVGTPERPLRVLFVGRLHWKKGLEYALEAMRRVREASVSAEFHIVGDGPDRRAVDEWVSRAGHVDDHVLGPRQRSGVRDELGWADVFLMPSLSEGFCCAALEAQSMGVPVVATEAEGLEENIVDGETGFIVPRRDAAAMARHLIQLAQSSELCHRLGVAGRQRASVIFDPDILLSSFGKMYDAAVGGAASQDVAQDAFISIILPTEGRSDLLEVALESLCKQTYASERYEVLVVEDGTTASTSDVVSRACERHSEVTIRYIGRPKEGLNACRNAGVELAEGDPIIFTDDDVDVPPGWLAAIARAVRRRPEVGAFGGPVWLRFEGRRPTLCPEHGVGKGEVSLGLGEEAINRNVIGANLAVRRFALESAGGFDEDVECGSGADSEWQVRWRGAGGEVFYVPDAWLWHRRTPDMQKITKIVRQRFKRSMNDVLYWRKTKGVGAARAQVRKVRPALHHARSTGCEAGLYESAMALGAATGLFLDRLGWHPLTRNLDRATSAPDAR